jgi:hypothetical protein
MNQNLDDPLELKLKGVLIAKLLSLTTKRMTRISGLLVSGLFTIKASPEVSVLEKRVSRPETTVPEHVTWPSPSFFDGRGVDAAAAAAGSADDEDDEEEDDEDLLDLCFFSFFVEAFKLEPSLNVKPAEEEEGVSVGEGEEVVKVTMRALL